MRSDEDLMVAYAAGDLSAFRELFARYAPILLRLLLRDLRVREEAQDLLQQVFLQLHRARRDYDPDRRVKPWLYTIALNLKREYFRFQKRRPTTSLEDTVRAEPVDTSFDPERADEARRVRRALGTLPPEQREVIELHWFEGLSFPEVAECLGITVSAAKVRAHRGYLRLRGRLDKADIPR
ncbi:MAG TPA: RNA polymerase sigma factor [Polyangiaceae bacterium]|jgi:RNA polymerase sigma-70 factor (ECF subfamily)